MKELTLVGEEGRDRQVLRPKLRGQRLEPYSAGQGSQEEREQGIHQLCDWLENCPLNF